MAWTSPTGRPNRGGTTPLNMRWPSSREAVLKDALTTLRPEQREVVVLAYFGGLTHSEISKHLDQPLGTVKTRMRLAIKKLRIVLEPQIRESAEHGL